LGLDVGQFVGHCLPAVWAEWLSLRLAQSEQIGPTHKPNTVAPKAWRAGKLLDQTRNCELALIDCGQTCAPVHQRASFQLSTGAAEAKAKLQLSSASISASTSSKFGISAFERLEQSVQLEANQKLSLKLRLKRTLKLKLTNANNNLSSFTENFPSSPLEQKGLRICHIR